MKKFTDIKRGIRESQSQKQNIAVPSVAILAPEDIDILDPKNAENTNVTKSEPAKFFSKIFEARQMAHVYHLQVKGDMGSHAAHTALNDFYDDILEHLDNLIETYQGQYEVVENYEIIDTTETNSKDKVEYFIGLNEFIKQTRYSALLEEDTHLQNIVDEIVALTYRLLYKLRFTK